MMPEDPLLRGGLSTTGASGSRVERREQSLGVLPACIAVTEVTEEGLEPPGDGFSRPHRLAVAIKLLKRGFTPRIGARLAQQSLPRCVSHASLAP